MTIQEILILIAAALTLGFIYQRTKWVNPLMIASIIFIYWLQPETELRYLGYWLPTISLTIMVICWAVTAFPENRSRPAHLGSLALIFLVLIALQLLRVFDLSRLLGFVAVPRSLGAFLVPLLLLGIAGLLFRSRQTTPPGALWGTFALLILIFLVLKTPALAEGASKAWRAVKGQSLALASAAELSWLGYSYLAFRILHTIRDKQAGRLPDIALNEYITYLVFFPAFVAGPIARVEQFTTSLREITGTFDEHLAAGSKRILIGLFKKFVLADSLALFALNAQNASQPTSTLGGWVLLISFSFQIYFDFSGYTDIAIGLGKYFDIQLPENFNQPYLKPNLTQFWSNWHMSLTNWFRAYFFNPISRSLRKKKLSALAILFITQISTMVLVGLWHGVTINFAVWGCWHGLGLLVQNRWSAWIKKRYKSAEQRWLQNLRDGFGTLLTFAFVTLGWVWFVLPTPKLALDFLGLLFGI